MYYVYKYAPKHIMRLLRSTLKSKKDVTTIKVTP